MGPELFIPAAGGYLFLRFTNWTRYRIYRETGYHLIFWTAAAGTFLYVPAHFVTLHILDYFTSVNDLIKLLPFDFGATHTTILLGVGLPPLINAIGSVFDFTKKDAMRKAALQGGSHIELIITESFSPRRLVEITLKNRKSYVGLAHEQGIAEMRDGRSDVTLIPIASGYRDKDTLKLEFTTDYFSMLEEYEKDNEKAEDRIQIEDLRVAIPMSEIMSARLFDFGVYRKFNQ